MRKFIPALLVLPLLLPLPGLAQIAPPAGAWRDDLSLPGLVVGFRIDDTVRKVRANNRNARLDMNGAAVVAQIPLTSAFSVWAEGGWNQSELAGEKAGDGYRYGLGFTTRPLRATRRRDPDLGPRDWTALRMDAGYRAGKSPSDRRGDQDWHMWELRLGIEDHQEYLGANRGPLNATSITMEGGMFFNDLQAEIPGFDASGRNSAGVYARVTFGAGDKAFYGLEADWMGASDRRFGLFGGMRF